MHWTFIMKNMLQKPLTLTAGPQYDNGYMINDNYRIQIFYKLQICRVYVSKCHSMCFTNVKINY